MDQALSEPDSGPSDFSSATAFWTPFYRFILFFLSASFWVLLFLSFEAASWFLFLCLFPLTASDFDGSSFISSSLDSSVLAFLELFCSWCYFVSSLIFFWLFSLFIRWISAILAWAFSFKLARLTPFSLLFFFFCLLFCASMWLGSTYRYITGTFSKTSSKKAKVASKVY